LESIANPMKISSLFDLTVPRSEWADQEKWSAGVAGSGYLGLAQECCELEVDQTEAAVLLSVGNIPHLRVVVPDAVAFQIRKEFLEATRVELIDAGTAVGGDQKQTLRVSRDQPRDEVATRLFKMAQDQNLVLEALPGLGALKRLAHAAVEADLDECPLGVLDGEHESKSKGKNLKPETGNLVEPRCHQACFQRLRGGNCLRSPPDSRLLRPWPQKSPLWH
jgi:hypothetical protein